MSRNKGKAGLDYLRLLADSVQEIKRMSYTCMRIQPRQRLLDIGCGPGLDTIPIAMLAGMNGMVVGVDHDETMIKIANQTTSDAGMEKVVKHICASAAELPFASGVFDACRSERLFQHLDNPTQGLAEMIRVATPGGRVVVVETDWASISVGTNEADIERRLMGMYTRGDVLKSGCAGRRLYRMFRQAQLNDVAIRIFPQFTTSYPLTRNIVKLDDVETQALSGNIITKEELQRWHTDLEYAEREGHFFASLNMIVAEGTT